MKQLTSEEWLKIFDEADDLGISFILLAGGEPMIRRDIIEAAGKNRIFSSRYLQTALIWMRDILTCSTGPEI